MLELRTRLRRLLHSPTYILAVVLSLALGTSVTLAALSVANSLIFKPLPGVADRRNLIRIEWAMGPARLTSAEVEAIEAHQFASFSAIAAQGESTVPVMLPAGPEAVSVAFVSPQVFTALGTRPLVGRLIGPGDAAAGAAPVAVLSERLWRRAFNGDPDILGRSLIVGERAFAIVGVTPESFSGLRVMDVGGRESAYPHVWLRLRDSQLWPATARPNHPWLSLNGRLSPSGTLKGARAEIELAASRIAAGPASPGAPDRRRASLRSYRAGLHWRDEPAQSLLTMALFLFVPLSVLAIGCVNVINLQLARGMGEAGELSLRLALGASRARILRLLLLEVAALAAICAGLGWVGARILLARAGAYLPVPPAIDGGVLAFTLVLVAGVVCVAGVLPAWQTSRDIVATGLREFHDQSRRRVRLRSALVAVQVAASVALLALGGVAIRSVMSRTPAIAADTRHILVADFDFTQVRPAAVRSGLFIGSILEDLGRAPSIRAAAFSTFTIGGTPMRYWRGSDRPEAARIAYGGFVTPGWFAATGLTFVAGSDAAFAHGSAVVNRALAAALEAGGAGSAIGTRLRVGTGRDVEVAAVVSDSERGSDGTPLPMLFLHMPSAVPPAIFLIARTVDVDAAKKAIHAAVTSVDPSVPIVRLDTMEARLDEQLKGIRAILSMTVAVGIVSIALAGAGLHSLLSYTVRRRKREIGIRVALGARRNEVIRLVMGPVVWQVSAGAAAGLASAVPIAIVLRSVLFGAASLDVAGLFPSIAILLAAAAAAAFGPAYHAVRIDPVRCLREE
jgi:putative ABC transport system permease protein